MDDMRLTQDQYDSYNESDEEEPISFGKAGLNYLWSNREMPVTFDEETYPISSSGKSVVVDTMTDMNKELCGCFRFR